jgi:Abnormal spindle-like microcephaly-assoc'd, ASPM-SPD-2-Hydin/Trypsin-like peptidase domain
VRVGLLFSIVISLLLQRLVASAEDVEPLRAGVVKIISSAEGKNKTGAGFIIKLEPGIAYIVTAGHVVEGDATPQVEFFTRQNIRTKAAVRKIEGGDLRGLALMVVRGKENLPQGLVALKLGAMVALKAGSDQVTAIGFPSGVASWGVLRVNVVSLEGSNIVLSKDLEEGNSGGPVIKDNLVVGLVMGLNQGFALAVPASIVKTVLTNWGVALEPDAAPPVKPDIAVKENGTAPRPRPPTLGSLALDTNRLEFGDQEVCGTQEKSILLTNRSSGSLRISRITLDEPRTFSAQGCVDQFVAPGESCTLNVKFAPKSKGAFQGLLTILNSVDSQPQFVVTAGIAAAEGVCCWYGYVYPMNKEHCRNIRGYFGVNELGFQCKKPRIQPYPIRPDCPPAN